jgi:hypothetical protein
MSRVQQVVVGSVIAGIVGGLVIAGIVGGFAMAGILPQVQGCWQDEQLRQHARAVPHAQLQDRLTLLGEGGCRTADGEQGEYTTISAVAFDECKAKCSEVNGQCTALEYNRNNGICEIHSEPITSFEGVAGVSCYRRE